jgi:serine/threonine protein kinase
MKRNTKALLNECIIYEYLKRQSSNFINKHTCFIKCSNGQLYLKNGGLSLKEMIKESDSTELFGLILKKLLEQIYFLHSLRVVHNDLHCGNVLVGKRDNINIGKMKNDLLEKLNANQYLTFPFVRKNIDIRFIDFGFAKILKSGQSPNLHFLEKIFIFFNEFYISIL